MRFRSGKLAGFANPFHLKQPFSNGKTLALNASCPGSLKMLSDGGDCKQAAKTALPTINIHWQANTYKVLAKGW